MAAPPAEAWKTLGKLIAALVAAGVLVAGIALPYVGGLGLVAGREADKFQDTTCNLPDSKPPQRTTLYARDGKTVLATLFSQDRVEIGLDQVPQTLQDALVATEDRRFYSHHGVDIRGLIRGAVNTTSGDTQGGSTLTMQYVKQVRYYEAGDDQKKQAAAIDQNLNRKIEDAKCAIYIEDTLKTPKKKILQNYLNIAFFGENSYGIETAARTYFNKPAKDLEPQESAMLVGLLRAPSAYDPFVNRVAAKERRDEVIQNMVAVGKWSQAEANRYKATPIQLATDAPPAVKQGCANSESQVQNVGFFCDYVRTWLMTRTGLTDQQLQTGGYRIITTLDPKLQNSAQKSLARSVPASSPYTATLPVVEPKTGNILAMAASKQYGIKTNQTVQPIFTKPVASPGSTIKLFPLLTALSMGFPADWTMQTNTGDGGYVPTNCVNQAPAKNNSEGDDFSTNETLTSAMVKSSNTFFAGLADQGMACRLDSMVALAQSLGISSLSDRVSAGSTKTVGQDIVGSQSPLRIVLASGLSASPLQMAGAYAAVANAGKFNPPAPVTMVYDSNGNAVDTKRLAGTQVVPAQAALTAIDIMKGDTNDPSGTSYSRFQQYYAAGGSNIAGKTGTALAQPSTKNGAIWFAGMTPSMVGVSAIIDFDNPTAPQRGLPGAAPGQAYGDYAAKVWLSAMAPTLRGERWTWPSPTDVQGSPVPDIQGATVADARKQLVAAGFKMHIFGTENQGNAATCASSVTTGDVAYYGPTVAPAGSTITVCESFGRQQPIYTTPPPTNPRRGTGTGRGNGGRGGGSSSSPAPGGGRSTAPPGNGGGGNSGGPNR